MLRKCLGNALDLRLCLVLHIPQPFLCNPDHLGGMRLGFGAAGLKAMNVHWLRVWCVNVPFYAICIHLFCRVRKGKNDWSQSLPTSSSIKVRCDQVVLSIFNARKLDYVARSFPSIAQVTQSLQKFSVFAVFSCDESSGTGLRTTCETIVNIRSLALNTGKFQSWSTQ